MFALLFSSCATAASAPWQEGQWVDLTHAFDENTSYWPSEKGFELETVSEGVTEKGYYYLAKRFQAAEHGGTHIDAPRHFGAGKWTVDQIPVEQLIGEAVVIDVSEKAKNDPDYQVEAQDFQDWETEHGQIPDGAIVILRTGYGKYWPQRIPYMGTDELGPEAVKNLHFPGLHPDAARWLVASRSIKAIGLDTPSLDYGQSTLFESHIILFEHNIPALENLANLDQLPAKGFSVIALPMKIKDGSGAPIRALAFLPE